jgi:hypothetical protein
VTEEIDILQVVLLEKLGDVRGHGGVRMGFGMWRVAVIPQILETVSESEWRDRHEIAIVWDSPR